MSAVIDVREFIQGMDKDTDVRRIPNGKYIDARNIKLNNPLTGKVGVLSNMMGIKGLSKYPYLTSEDTIVGMYPDNFNNCIYILVQNALTKHKILKYYPSTETFSFIVVSSALNFNVNYPIRALDVVEDSLYWTDFYNQPGSYMTGFDYLTAMGYTAWAVGTTYTTNDLKIYNGFLYRSLQTNNVGHTPSGDLSDTIWWKFELSQGYDSSYFAGAKKVPIDPPTWVLQTDTAFSGNYLVDKYLQFKYRFVYKNGQKSVFSPISSMVYSERDYYNKQATANNSTYNKLVVTVPNTNANRFVDKIEVAAREGNNGDFFLINTITADSSYFTSGSTFEFYNNSLYTSIALAESNQLYDDFPIKSRSQRFIANRMMYGGTINGYDKIAVSYSVGKCFATRSSNTTYTALGDSTIRRDMLTDSTGVKFRDWCNTNGYSLTLQPSDVFVLEGLSVSGGQYGTSTISFGTAQVTALPGWGWNDLVAAFNTFTFNLVDYVSNPGNPQNYTLSFLGQHVEYRYDLPPGDPLYGTSRYVYNQSFKCTITSGSSEHQSTFKSGSYYNVGLQYYDDYGRTNGVHINNEARVYISTIPERNVTSGSYVNAGATYIVVTINNKPPSWAKYYSIVWSNAYKESIVLGLTVDKVKQGLTSGMAKISLQSLYTNIQYYNTNLAYTWQKGDRIRFITYDSNGGNAAGLAEWADKVYDSELVNSYPNYDTNTETGDGDASVEFNLPNGLAINQIRDAQIEIYRPSYMTNAAQSIFHEGVIYPISGGNHMGYIPQTTSGTAVNVPHKAARVSGSTKWMNIPGTLFWQGAVVPGDTITFTSGTYNGNTATVTSVVYNADFSADITFSSAPWSSENLSATGEFSYTLTNKPAIAFLTKGDAYVRKRYLKYNNSGICGATSCPTQIESYMVSDYNTASEQYSKGRPTAVINQGQTDNYATIFYSEAFIPNTDINGLNKIYPDNNYQEYTKSFGSILLMTDEGDSMLVFQEDKVSRVLVGKSVIYDAQGNANYMGTVANVLSESIPYLGTYGLQQPNSYQAYGGRKYWVDSGRGMVLRLSANGIEPISKYGMRGFFADTCKDLTRQPEADQLIAGMYDPLTDEYTVSFVFNDDTVVFYENSNLWSGILDTPFTCSCYIDNKTFYASGYDFNEINRGDVPFNTIKYADGDSEILESSISFPCNIAPGNLKTFEALTIDGNFAWDVEISTKQINKFGDQFTSMNESDFVMYETEYMTPILRDASTPNCINPIINGYPMKGMEAVISLYLPIDNSQQECYIKTVKIATTKG